MHLATTSRAAAFVAAALPLAGLLAQDGTAGPTTATTATNATIAPTLAPPVRLHAGDKLLGEGRLFPSPVFHDVNGDGRLDLVVGDLRGRMTIALREPGDGPPRYAAETELKDENGVVLDFANW